MHGDCIHIARVYYLCMVIVHIARVYYLCMVTVRRVLLSTVTKHVCYEGGHGTHVANHSKED